MLWWLNNWLYLIADMVSLGSFTKDVMDGLVSRKKTQKSTYQCSNVLVLTQHDTDTHPSSEVMCISINLSSLLNMFINIRRYMCINIHTYVVTNKCMCICTHIYFSSIYLPISIIWRILSIVLCLWIDIHIL
jgi:hypothetical protein